MSYSVLLQSRAKYLHVAKQMKAYEDQLYEQWREGVEHILPGLLRRNLLVKPILKDSSASVVGDDDKEKEAGACARCLVYSCVAVVCAYMISVGISV